MAKTAATAMLPMGVDGDLNPREDVADPFMPASDVLGENAVRLPHAFGGVAFDRLHDEMIVVGHQAIGMAGPVEALADGTEDTEPRNAIVIASKDVLAPVTTRRDVVQAPRKLDAQRTSHASSYGSALLRCKT